MKIAVSKTHGLYTLNFQFSNIRELGYKDGFIILAETLTAKYNDVMNFAVNSSTNHRGVKNVQFEERGKRGI